MKNNFFKRLIDSNDSSVNSKIIVTSIGLLLLITTTVLVLIGIPPVDAIYVGDLIWALIVMICTSAGIEVTNQMFNK